MPLYVIKCTKCNHVFDYMMSLKELEAYTSNNHHVLCEQCQSELTVLKPTATRTKDKSWYTLSV